MSSEIELRLIPEYRATIEKLDGIRRKTETGNDYWMAREIATLLGYANWANFQNVIKKAKEACGGIGLDPSNHFAEASVMMEVGRGARREGEDWFLSRPACYLIAMNGDSAKPEIAAAQAYFAIQSRRMELEDQRNADAQRLDMREKVTESFKRVAGVAQDAGVVRQAIFHDARYRGLYGMPMREVKKRKGIKDKENLLDRAGVLELSANDFQMNLAAEIIATKGIKGENAAIVVNQRIGAEVRQTMQKEGATLPENLPVEPPIAEVRKRLAAAEKTATITAGPDDRASGS